MLIPARLSIGRFPRFGDWLGHLNKIWEQWQKCLRNSDLSCWNVENGLAASLYLSMRCLRKRLLTSCLFLRHTPYCIFHRKRLRDSHVNDPLILEAPLGKLADGSGWQNNKFCICDGSILWSLVGELCGREVCFTLVYPSGFCHSYKTPGFFSTEDLFSILVGAEDINMTLQNFGSNKIIWVEGENQCSSCRGGVWFGENYLCAGGGWYQTGEWVQGNRQQGRGSCRTARRKISTLYLRLCLIFFPFYKPEV